MKTDLAEIEQRILCDLEEADGVTENVFALINSVTPAKGEPPEIVEFGNALRSLIERGLIFVGLGTLDHRQLEQPTMSTSLELVEELPSWFRYNGSASGWTLGRGDFQTSSYPFACLTEHGRLQAREVMEARGFRWWNRS